MSKELGIIPHTGTRDVPLYITQFCGPVGKGLMLQLTQETDINTTQYILLTKKDVLRLLMVLEGWMLVRQGVNQ